MSSAVPQTSQVLSPANGPQGTPTPLDQLSMALSDDMAATNTLIIARMQSHVPMIPQLAGYLIAAGGKRIRPLLTLAAAQICGGADKARGLAASVEFIHTATLLHDDVVDESAQRRGKPAANTVYGNKESVLVGDFLFARAFELMVESDDLRILEILSRASRIISEGEILQMSLTGDVAITMQQYEAIIEAKTAALFSAATHAGALAAGANDAQAESLRKYGHHLGMSFQMIDDVMDYASSDNAMGKNAGDDFHEGKLTLPVLLALQNADSDEKAFWQRTMGDHNQTSGDFQTARRLIEKHGCLALGRQAAENQASQGRAALAGLPDGSIKANLDDLLDFVVSRNH
ncbi:MAG TPA: polyprenyl synthetase family protein [Alphaproteobacteria bacterium]